MFLGEGICSDRDIDEAEVITGISRLRNNKALGGSWLSAELLKQISAQVAPALVHMFNCVRH